MNLPTREHVAEWGMWFYGNVFVLVFLVSLVTVLYILHNLLPRKEY